MKRIFLHGLGQTYTSWDKVLCILDDNEKSLCVDLADLIKDRNVTYDNMYRAFSEVCDKQSEQIDLCGLSLGGVLALNYAIDNPKK